VQLSAILSSYGVSSNGLAEHKTTFTECELMEGVQLNDSWYPDSIITSVPRMCSHMSTVLASEADEKSGYAALIHS
jgi:hypothetical protein